MTAQRPLRVCFVIAAPAGQAAMVAVMKHLRATHGCEVAVVVGDPGSAFAHDARAAGAEVHGAPFDFAAFPGWRDLTRRAVGLSHLFQRQRFDVVITSLWQSMLVGRLAAWVADVPVRIARVAGPFHLEAPLSRWIDIRTCWMDHLLVGVCERIAELYRQNGVSIDRLRVLHSARDASDYAPPPMTHSTLREELRLPPETRLVGMVSWFYPAMTQTYWSPVHLWGRSVKGHETFLTSAARVAGVRQDVHFVCVGGGWGPAGERYMAEMRDLACQLRIEDRVTFLGARSDIAAIYRQLDLVVHPSRNEGTGGAVESLLMKCPTVASRTGGLVDLVIDGVTGSVVEPDDPAALARTIQHVLDHPHRARELAEAGYHHVRSLCDAAASARTIVTWVAATLERNGRGFRASTSLRRRLALAPMTMWLGLGIRIEEASCRLRFHDPENAEARSGLNLVALVGTGPAREQIVAGWVRQQLAVVRGYALSGRQRTASRLGVIRGAVSVWFRRAQP